MPTYAVKNELAEKRPGKKTSKPLINVKIVKATIPTYAPYGCMIDWYGISLWP